MRWIARVEGGPRRVNHSAVAIGDKIYSFGGHCSGEDYETKKPIDIYQLDTVTYRWSPVGPSCSAGYKREDPTSMTIGPSSGEPNPASAISPNVPHRRYGHTTVVYGDKVYLWGGRSDSAEGASAVLHEYDPVNDSWRVVAPISGSTGMPPARDGHSACVIGDKMYVFGGFEDELQRFSQETYSFDFGRQTWQLETTTGCPPAWRDFHTAVALNNRMYVFGGRSDHMGQFHSSYDIYFDKLHYLNVDSMSWHQPEVRGLRPSGRRSHCCWAYDGKMYLFGGYSATENKHYNDMYAYDPVTSHWTEVLASGERPTPRRRMCVVPVGQKLFLFGGTMPLLSCVSGQMEPLEVVYAANYWAERHLIDLSDLYILDYEPSLFTLCLDTVIKRRLYDPSSFDGLPWIIRSHILATSIPNKISAPRSDNSG